jgi:nicotinamidase-related amidase
VHSDSPCSGSQPGISSRRRKTHSGGGVILRYIPRSPQEDNRAGRSSASGWQQTQEACPQRPAAKRDKNDFHAGKQPQSKQLLFRANLQRSGANLLCYGTGMQKPVLIVIDMLNDFLDKWNRSDRDRLVDAINELVQIVRQADLPVIWVRQEFESDLSDAFPEMRQKKIHVAIKGTSGSEFDARLKVSPSDMVIVKKRYSAFFGTGLDEVLDRLRPDGLILAGINTHACIRTTAIDAYQRDWPLILASDCVDSYDREHHRVTLNYMKDKLALLMTNHQIDAMLGANQN